MKIIMKQLKKDYDNKQQSAQAVVGPPDEDQPDKLKEFQNQPLFQPARTSEVKHNFTSRSGTYSSMNETHRTNQQSDVTQKLMSEYLTHLRERNFSL